MYKNMTIIETVRILFFDYFDLKQNFSSKIDETSSYNGLCTIFTNYKKK